MTAIAALIPTNRPHLLEQLFACADETDTTQVTWLIGLDDDDTQTYPERSDTRYIRTPRNQLAVKANELAELAWDEFGILGQFDDDQWPRSKGWDHAVIDAIARQPGLVYCDDGWMGEQTPVCPFWPSRFAKTIGWLYHPELIHLFCDNVLQELARAINRTTYLGHVLIEHCHPMVGKNEWDDSYKHSNSGEMWSHDEAVFKAYVASDAFQADVAKLREVM